MRKSLCCLTVLLFFNSECLSQSRWAFPKLQWLTQADAISNANLSAKETSFLKTLTRKIIADCIDYPGQPHTTRIFNSMRVRRVQLSEEGNDPGLIVQGAACMCGATGNCSFWLIGEQAHPRVLLQKIGIQTFAFQKSSTTNHFDIVLGQHSSATESILQRFQFDGTNYKRDGCATAEWADPDGNALHPPRITPERCY
jgi:hypothetical protein